jgi:LssY C-terminus
MRFVLSESRFSGGIVRRRVARPWGRRFSLWGAWLCLLAAGFFAGAMPATACDEVPAGTTLWVQLVSHVSSDDAKPGMRVQALLEQDVECGGEVLFPLGTRVEGEIRRVQKVGWGIRHETAALDLQFDRVLPDGDGPVEMSARVAEVDNARESVKNGVIRGIRATDTPQGRINSRLKHLPALNPYSDTVLIVFKAAFPIFPEPEIYYAPGTELKLELVSALTRSSIVEPLVNHEDFSPEDVLALDEITLSEPERTYTREHKVADVINLAFLGTQEQVEAAFQRANWAGSDSFSKRAFVLQFNALLNESSYVRAPMMPMLVDDKLPEMTFQKSLNSYSKRDHVRLWKREESCAGEPVWLAAATHDVGASLSLRQRKFVHHIDPDIDQERAKVIRDLRLAGCVESVVLAPRPDVPSQEVNATGEEMRTDGELAVVRLKDCTSELGATPQPSAPFRARNRVFRYVRDQILIFRSDIWRANIIYGVYDLGRMTVAASRHHPAAAPTSPQVGIAAGGAHVCVLYERRGF